MNVKNLVLGIGIVVVFALVLWQGVEAFYPSPDWQDYCGSVGPTKPDTELTSEECVASGGTWQNGYCDYYVECQKMFEEENGKHSQAVFFISLIVAIVVGLIGFTLLKVEPVGSALIGSGIWAIFWGSVINWQNFSTAIRFILLLIVFVLLVWITARINRKKK